MRPLVVSHLGHRGGVARVRGVDHHLAVHVLTADAAAVLDPRRVVDHAIPRGIRIGFFPAGHRALRDIRRYEVRAAFRKGRAPDWHHDGQKCLTVRHHDRIRLTLLNDDPHFFCAHFAGLGKRITQVICRHRNHPTARVRINALRSVRSKIRIRRRKADAVADLVKHHRWRHILARFFGQRERRHLHETKRLARVHLAVELRILRFFDGDLSVVGENNELGRNLPPIRVLLRVPGLIVEHSLAVLVQLQAASAERHKHAPAVCGNGVLPVLHRGQQHMARFILRLRQLGGFRHILGLRALH